MATNADLLKALKSAPRARFYLCDLHVHSPASSDVRQGERFDLLSPEEKELVKEANAGLVKQPAAYEEKIMSAFPISRYHNLLTRQRDKIAKRESISIGEDWSFVAITDHNVCTYSCALSEYAWNQREASRLIVLPGIELDVSFPISGEEKTEAHIILIFSPGTRSDDIRVAIRDLTKNNWALGQTAEVDSLPDFIKGMRMHADYPAISIAAHISSGKGVREAVKKKQEEITFTALDAAIARASAEFEQNLEADKEALRTHIQHLNNERKRMEEKISLEVLKLIGSCGFDGLQVSCKQDEIHYRRLHRFDRECGRAVPIIASDAHCVSEVFICEESIPYLKMPIQSSDLKSEQILSDMRHALRYGETRFSYCTPGPVTRWISGIGIEPDSKDAAAFWPFGTDESGRKPFILPLSRNLNCLVGGRGSGKSAAIEAIAFVARPNDFLGKYRKDENILEDWYKRAKATLAGCQVCLVWQSPGSTPDLPKGALFCSRYFNQYGEHEQVSYSTVENKEVLESSLDLETVQLFRTRDIESAVKPERLRILFDGLVGDKIPEIEKDIRAKLSELEKQRDDMVGIAHKVMELTTNDKPLREYVRRKIAYEAANRAEVQQFYDVLDKTGAAETIAQDAKKRWDKAVEEANIAGEQRKFDKILDTVLKKIQDDKKEIKQFCEGIGILFKKDESGLSPRNRLNLAFNELSRELDSFGSLLNIAFEHTKAQHKTAREDLIAHGLPAGAKDREAKKNNYESAEADLATYIDLMSQWQERIGKRNQLFVTLIEKCQDRTKLRMLTSIRLNTQLARDLDPSILAIVIKVHPMEDKIIFKEWLADNIAPCISRYKDARISAVLDKGVMPKQMRDVLLCEDEEGASLFIVDKDKASNGGIDRGLAEEIINKCSGKIQLEAEHHIIKEVLSPDFLENLPREIREGLWTFPKIDQKSNDLVLDAVLKLDEIVFDDRPEILLNDRPEETGSMLRPIGELSPGQRCSAILPILLLNGQSPLIIDQPEDNLDNRLIRQVIVNILASIKLRRQVIVATHNPNLPVLGDVEQAIILRAVEEKQCRLESSGDLDSANTVAQLTEIMEGGREAFQYRQSIYQDHWGGQVDNTSILPNRAE